MKPQHLSVEDAYRNDVAFAAVVDQLEYFIHRAELTPAEVRGAAMLACLHYEQKQMRSICVPLGAGEREQLYAIENRIAQLKRWADPDADHPYRTRGGT